MICQHCHKQVPDGSKFCNHCGTKIVTEDKLACTNQSCPDFGLHILPVDSKFCPSCGQRIELVNSSSLPSASIKTFTVNRVSFDMILVTGGTFMMGATSEQGDEANNDESPIHQVTLKNYYIGETIVTQGLWEAVMGATITHKRKAWQSQGKGFAYPMYNINYSECLEFIHKLNSMTGQKFRLPTEAEWEFAARGGNKSKGYKYSGSNELNDVAWYKDNSNSNTHSVKTKSPNELGLYDMSGNVWEWCIDWYGKYNGNIQTNPTGPSTGSSRVLRGGCWLNNAQFCRVSFRLFGTPNHRNDNLGLRLALSM